MSKLLAAVFAAMFALGTVSVYAADTKKDEPKKEMKKEEAKKEAKKEEAKKEAKKEEKKGK